MCTTKSWRRHTDCVRVKEVVGWRYFIQDTALRGFRHCYDYESPWKGDKPCCVKRASKNLELKNATT